MRKIEHVYDGFPSLYDTLLCSLGPNERVEYA